MLELRPSCEHCNKPLPPNSTEAMMCSYECTFCRKCVDDVLENVCPNCGGGFCNRPVRPSKNLRNGNFTGQNPPTSEVTYSPVNKEDHALFASNIKGIPAYER